jgi:lysyl-tRNA synthetase class II
MESGAEQKFSTAGRLMSYRTHGKLAFAKIRDDGGDIQLCFVRGKCKLHTGKKIVELLTIDLTAGEEGIMDAYKFVDKFIDV